MAITKEHIISEIELALLQGSPSDESELDREQVAFWIQEYLNDLVRREIIDELRKGNPVPPIYLVRETGLSLTEETVADIADVDQRMYLQIAGEILDLPRDAGLVRVIDYDLNLIPKTSSNELEHVRNLRFAKPSQDNVLHYREGKKIFVVGFNTADLDFNDFIAIYAKKQDVLSLADTGEVLISDQLLPVLVDLCVTKGKQQLYGTLADKENEGTDVKQPFYHTAIRNSPSEPVQRPSE